MTAPKAMSKRTPEQIHAAQGYPSRLMLPESGPQLEKPFFTTLLTGEECFRFVHQLQQVAPCTSPKIKFCVEYEDLYLGHVCCEGLVPVDQELCKRIEWEVQNPKQEVQQ